MKVLVLILQSPPPPPQKKTKQKKIPNYLKKNHLNCVLCNVRAYTVTGTIISWSMTV